MICITRPVGRCLIGKGPRYLELADKKELSKALKGRSIDYFIQGSEQLFDVSAMYPIYDGSIVHLNDIDFPPPHGGQVPLLSLPFS